MYLPCARGFSDCYVLVVTVQYNNIKILRMLDVCGVKNDDLYYVLRIWGLARIRDKGTYKLKLQYSTHPIFKLNVIINNRSRKRKSKNRVVHQNRSIYFVHYIRKLIFDNNNNLKIYNSSIKN